MEASRWWSSKISTLKASSSPWVRKQEARPAELPPAPVHPVRPTHPCPALAAQQRSWLLLQVDIDTHFLQRLNVLDYSFLLAQQPLQPDERLQVLSLGTLIIRTKR